MRRPALVAAALVPLLATVAAGCSAGPVPSGGAGSAPPVTSAPAAPSTSAAQTPSPTTPSPSPTPRTTPSAPARPTCASVVSRMSLAEQVGQVVMVAQSSTQASAAGRRTVERLHLGSVVLLGNSTAGRTATARLTTTLSRAVGRVDGVGLLVAADQEGGLVQRLQGPGFTRIPSAVEQARWSDQTLRRRATTWSDELDRAGVDLDLAPVADVVPSSVGTGNAPIGALRRGYGPRPAVVADKTVAVVEGLHAGGTASAVKHFPGLGRVRGNTDVAAVVVDTATTRHDALLAGFRATVTHGTDAVMLSSATYRKIDPDHPATYSRTVATSMLRGDLSFRGVVVSDDLLGRALGGTPVGSRGVRFLEAGGDLALVGGLGPAEQVHRGLLDRAREDRAFRTRVAQSATRVVELKSRQGLASCTRA
ncbi:glycoside hydrolase family 3 N-terminal domain-containing protein [Microlunatus flavus]|uniref:beta-N-acetylhexosaminidase n=1 Tax=Microlunatus flavus TaxID=1036181 RepID=A0A1H9IBY4_9ACTN|nr:glycoside hydrolase family 3 N-terminal domain-containing protein [Microlunatus flavus]SEQ71905.1 beta-N-acetylhexosaminidase [Microlunatus flavus]